jgi:hypothetical protein
MRAMPARLRQATQWIALLVLLALGGCSTIKFAYNNVDWLLLDKADYYLDLDDAQQERARKLLAARMEAHRREELPIYVVNLIQIRAMLADNLTPAEVEAIKEQIQGLYQRTMGDTIPGIVSVLADINSTQIDHLQARFDERNREFENDFMAESMQVRLARRVERSTRMIEFFTGYLREDQVALVTRYRNAMPLAAGEWLAYHRERQRELVAMLKRRASHEQLEAFLTAWWVELADQPPALAHKMQLNSEAWSRMMLALDKTLDVQQRRNVLDRLDQFIEAFSELVPEKAA